IISSTLMCVVIINNHSLTDTVLTTLFFPILISIFYFDKKLTYLSGMLSLSAYLGLVEYNYFVAFRTTPTEKITMILILIGSTFIAASIMDRGVELLQVITKEIRTKEELIQKHAITEKLSKTDALTGLNNHLAFQEYL